MDDALLSQARAWRDDDPDPTTRAEVDALVVDEPAGDLGLDRLGGLGVLTRAGLDGDLALGEAQPDGCVALGDEGDALDRLDERSGRDDRLRVGRRGEDRGDLGVLAVEEP